MNNYKLAKIENPISRKITQTAGAALLLMYIGLTWWITNLDPSVLQKLSVILLPILLSTTVMALGYWPKCWHPNPTANWR